MSEHVKMLREREKTVRDKLESYRQTCKEGTNINLAEVLNIAHAFIESQTEDFEEISSTEEEK
jgi:hypothetical protein